MKLKFSAAILQNKGMDATYVEVPYDIKALFGKGRLLVNATFDGIPYRGQVLKKHNIIQFPLQRDTSDYIPGWKL